MPEGPEVRLTSDYINKHQNIKFQSLKKSLVHKGEDIKIEKEFNIKSESRGKELKLIFTGVDEDWKKELYVTLGMSGFFKWSERGFNKHAHLLFTSRIGTFTFVDQRRFGKWKWDDNWNKSRGPCWMLEWDDAVLNIVGNIESKSFDKPIHEVLMNQKWFNGIGNYLRAEILGRMDINPFQPARQVFEKRGMALFKLCRDIQLQSYQLGGGQLIDWKNPDGTDPDEFTEFIRFYQKPNCNHVKDKNGRRFWYKKKFEKYLPS